MGNAWGRGGRLNGGLRRTLLAHVAQLSAQAVDHSAHGSQLLLSAHGSQFLRSAHGGPLLLQLSAHG
jgi:hypothetical protein